MFSTWSTALLRAACAKSPVSSWVVIHHTSQGINQMYIFVVSAPSAQAGLMGPGQGRRAAPPPLPIVKFPLSGQRHASRRLGPGERKHRKSPAEANSAWSEARRTPGSWSPRVEGLILVQQHSHVPVKQSRKVPHAHTALQQQWTFLPHAAPGNQEVLPNLCRPPWRCQPHGQRL